MKVYLVTSGAYSDYGVRAVFTDRKTAELYCAVRDSRNTETYDFHDIEEWETIDACIEGNGKEIRCVWVAHKNVFGIWMVHFYKYILEGMKLPDSDDNTVYFMTWDRDEKKAEKFWQDVVARRKAEGMV